MKHPKHAKGHQAIHNLGAYAHPPKAGPTNTAKPERFQTEPATKLIGKKVPPASVSRPRMRGG